jgi:hypothetical protein
MRQCRRFLEPPSKRSTVALHHQAPRLLQPRLNRVAAPTIEGDEGAQFNVADQALALETELRIERASDDFRPTLADRFYEDSFVKPFLMAASMGGASWAPHEGVADAS